MKYGGANEIERNMIRSIRLRTLRGARGTDCLVLNLIQVIESSFLPPKNCSFEILFACYRF